MKLDMKWVSKNEEKVAAIRHDLKNHLSELIK